MSGLTEIYNNTKNPLDNPQVIEDLISAYTKSDRLSFQGGGIYNSLVTLGSKKDNTITNSSDRESFYIDTYNQWIEKIMALTPKQLQELDGSGMDASKLQEYLASFGKVSSMSDITKLNSNPLFEKALNTWELEDGGWTHVKSMYINGRQEDKIDIKHRLYIGCENQDIWKICSLFKEKCEQANIPYYFKCAESRDRADKIVIYSDTQELSEYISILQEIGKENPEIIARCGNPPALTGRIGDWIGIGDDPPKKENGENQSFNEIRAEIIDNAIEEVLLESIMPSKYKQVEYNGKIQTFHDIFVEISAKCLVENLHNNPRKAKAYSINEEDFKSGRLEKVVKYHLNNSIQNGLQKLDEVKDKKAELGIASNGSPIFSIPTRNGKAIPVDTLDMDKIIKSMLPTMQQLDPQFNSKVKDKIYEKCKEAGIDTSTFCFQESTRELFEQIDSKTEELEEKDDSSHNISNTQIEPEISKKESIELNNPAFSGITYGIMKKNIKTKNHVTEDSQDHIETSNTGLLASAVLATQKATRISEINEQTANIKLLHRGRTLENSAEKDVQEI